MRILHVFSGLDRGGAETWFMHMLRRLDRECFAVDVLVRSDRAGAYATEVEALGGRVISGFTHRRYWQYGRDFRRILQQYGPYDVVHSHIRHFSGYVLRLAHAAGIPRRIVHIHSDNRHEYATAGLARRFYLKLSQYWIETFATAGLYTSRQAAAAMAGADWERDPRWRILYCGIDLAPFGEKIDATRVRAELGLAADARVFGHVGRFVAEKNHRLLIEIMMELRRQEPRSRLLLIGDGPLLPSLRSQVDAAGLSGHVVFAGARPDVARLMLGAMDGFILPSFFEGLGMALVEAQAAGLPCTCSSVVPDEAIVVNDLVQRLALRRPVEDWAAAILAQQARARPDQRVALARVQASPFAVEHSLAALVAVYQDHGAVDARCNVSQRD